MNNFIKVLAMATFSAVGTALGMAFVILWFQGKIWPTPAEMLSTNTTLTTEANLLFTLPILVVLSIILTYESWERFFFGGKG